VERVETAILDWKGIKGEDKPSLIDALGKAGLKLERA